MRQTFHLPGESIDMLDAIASAEGLSREDALGSALSFLNDLLNAKAGRPYPDAIEYLVLIPQEHRFWTSMKPVQLFPIGHVEYEKPVAPVAFDLPRTAVDYINTSATRYQDTPSRLVRDAIVLFKRALDHAEQRHRMVWGYPNVANFAVIKPRSFLKHLNWHQAPERGVA